MKKIEQGVNKRTIGNRVAVIKNLTGNRNLTCSSKLLVEVRDEVALGVIKNKFIKTDRRKCEMLQGKAKVEVHD